MPSLSTHATHNSEAAVSDNAVGSGRVSGCLGKEEDSIVKPTPDVAKAGRCLFSVLASVSREPHLICLSEWIHA